MSVRHLIRSYSYTSKDLKVTVREHHIQSIASLEIMATAVLSDLQTGAVMVDTLDVEDLALAAASVETQDTVNVNGKQDLTSKINTYGSSTHRGSVSENSTHRSYTFDDDSSVTRAHTHNRRQHQTFTTTQTQSLQVRDLKSQQSPTTKTPPSLHHPLLQTLPQILPHAITEPRGPNPRKAEPLYRPRTFPLRIFCTVYGDVGTFADHGGESP